MWSKIIGKVGSLGVPDNVKNFYGENKSKLWMVLGALLIFGLGYGSGRYVQPEKIVEREKIKEVEKEVIVEKIVTKIEIQKVYVEKKNEKVHRVVTETENKDGSKTKTTTEDSDTNTDVDSKESTTQVKYVDRIVEKVVEKIVEKEKIVTGKKPNWHIGANVGLAIPRFLGQGEYGIPGLEGAVIGVTASRRIIGPVFLDLHGNSQGTVGLGLTGEF